jgi:hypothetical protein
MDVVNTVCSLYLTLLQVVYWWISDVDHALCVELCFTLPTIEARLTRAHLLAYFLFLQLKLVAVVFLKYLVLLPAYSNPLFLCFVEVPHLCLQTSFAIVEAPVFGLQEDFLQFFDVQDIALRIKP